MLLEKWGFAVVTGIYETEDMGVKTLIWHK